MLIVIIVRILVLLIQIAKKEDSALLFTILLKLMSFWKEDYINGFSNNAERYFSKDSLEPSYFNEECGWVDFPDDLGRIEFTKEFRSNEFHFADIYVVNHKQDNIIKFKPN